MGHLALRPQQSGHLQEVQRCAWLWRHLPKLQESAFDADHADGSWVRENVDRIHMGGHGPGSFSRIHSGLVPPQTVQHDLAVLAQIAKLAKPGAHITVAQAVVRKECTQIS